MSTTEPLRRLCGLSFALSCGLLLFVLASTRTFDAAVPPNLYPMISALVYLMSPCPGFLCGGRACRGGSGGYAALAAAPAVHRQTLCPDASFFFSGLFLTSGVGVPVILAHARIISEAAAGLSVVGGVIVYAALSGYIHSFSSSSSSTSSALFSHPE